MIKLTVGVNSVWVNPELIMDVGHSDYYDGTVLRMNGDHAEEHPLTVTESPEEVAQKIINYKLAMIDYTSAKNGVTQVLVENGYDIYAELRDEYGRIYEFAGLEVSK